MHDVSFILVCWWWCSAARAGGVRVCLGQIIDIGVGIIESVLVPSTQILPAKLGPQHYNIILTPKQSLDVVGLIELEILHIEAWFGDENYIVILWAELGWEYLGGRYQYSFNNPNPNLKNSTETKSDPTSHS